MSQLPPLVALLFLVGGCVNEPLATSPSNNPDVQVETLLTHEGCTVYRFKDGAYHYYVRCNDTPSSSHTVTQTFSCLGKGCNVDDSIQTLTASAR